MDPAPDTAADQVVAPALSPLQTLVINDDDRKKTKLVSLLHPDNNTTPLYLLDESKRKKRLVITRADAANTPLATTTFHWLNSKIDIEWAHNSTFTVKKDREFSRDGHSFTEPSLGGEVEWKDTGFLRSNVELIDKEQKILAVYRRKLEQVDERSSVARIWGKDPPHGIEIYVPIESNRVLDLVVITGLACAEYRKQSNEEWGVVGKKGVKGIAEGIGDVSGDGGGGGGG